MNFCHHLSIILRPLKATCLNGNLQREIERGLSMNRLLPHRTALMTVTVLLTLNWGCKEKTDLDPRRCQIQEAGEAADLLNRPDFPLDRMVRVQGITYPKALVWKDKTTGIVNFTARVMGTEQRLFYLRTIPQGASPGILSELTGHLSRWDRLPEARMKPIAAALKQQYNINIVPEKTYVIDADGKPEGCP